MDFELTTERQDYLDARKYTILLACPGSGKTTCIVQKLKTITRECEQTRSRGVGVLCLSFTNKACEEIKQKYRELHGENLKYPHEVCTIDSFVTRYILMPFWCLYKNIGQKPSVINEKEISRSIYYRRNDDGREVLLKQFLRFGPDVHIYKPEDLTLSEAGYKFIGKSYNKMVLADAEKDLSDYSKKVWEYRIGKGILNSTDTLWVGKYIIEHNPEIAQTLAQRFPYIVVDEAQDTSKWQFDIFEKLRNGGVENMEFVGDLNQSICCTFLYVLLVSKLLVYIFTPIIKNIGGSFKIMIAALMTFYNLNSSPKNVQKRPFFSFFSRFSLSLHSQIQ